MKKTSVAMAILLCSISGTVLSQIQNKQRLIHRAEAETFYDRADKLTESSKNNAAYQQIEKALALEPNNIKYLKSRAEIASELNKSDIMEDSYARILKIEPDNEEALYNHALAESWQDSKSDQAEADFQYVLKLFPNKKEAYINYANLESWREKYIIALGILENYRERFGATKEYLHTKARVLVLSGQYSSAMKINDDLLDAEPSNYDYLYTNVSALQKAHRTREAMIAFEKLQQIKPNDDDTKELKNMFLELTRSNFTVGGDYFHDNQSVQISQIPISFNLYVDPETHVIIEALQEHLSANLDSGLENINGNAGISDESLWAGYQRRLSPVLDFKALGGGIHIEGVEDQFIYLVNADIQLDETSIFSVTNLRNLYRPYLVGTSPKSVSLGILEDLTVGHLAWSPTLDISVEGLLSYSRLTDGNTYVRFNTSPTKKYIINSQTTVNLGVDVDFLSFAEQLNNGYYDPEFHQEYLATGDLSYQFDSKTSASLGVGVGTHRDQSTGGFQLADGASAGIDVDINKTWQASVGGDYTYRGSVAGAYNDYTMYAKIHGIFA